MTPTWTSSAGCQVVLYGAKSTQDKRNSISTQLADGRALADTNGWEIIGQYDDEGFSAYSGNRGQGLIDAEAHATRAAAETGSVVMLVTQAHDRFARGAGDKPGASDSLGEVWHRCRRKNVWLRSAEDDEELRDEASVAAVGRRAHIDSARKAKSVRNGQKRRKARGMHTGGPRKFGYEFARYPDGITIADAPMLVHPTESVIYREQIYGPAMAGLNARAIVHALTDAGVPTTTTNGRWHPSTIRKILLDPFYAGKVRQLDSDELVDGEHTALVSYEDWLALQALRAGQAHNRGGRKPTGNRALFVNRHLRCGQCGGVMGYRSKPNRTGGKWERYVCCERERDARSCSQPPVEVDALEQAAVRALMHETGSVSGLAQRRLAEHHGAVELTEAQLIDARRQVAQSHERGQRAETDYLDGRLPVELYERAVKRVSGERVAAEAQVSQLEQHLGALRDRAQHVDVERAMISAMQELVSALTGDNPDHARTVLRRAFPVITLRATEGRLWLDLGAPDDAWVTTRLDDELGALYADRPVLSGGSATTGHDVLTLAPVVAEVELGT